MKSELEKKTEICEKLETLEKTVKTEEKETTKRRGLNLKNISGKTFGMMRERSKIMSVISVAAHQVVKNSSERS